MMRRAAAVVIAAALLLLAGCSDIPTSGKVQLGPTQDVKNQDVVLVPYKPAPGASQTDIVQGFITAATGQQSDYAVAREFLTPALAKRWQPGGRVLIHDQAWQLKTVSDTSMTVTVPTTAQVNADGVYTSYATPRNTIVRFQLDRVNGQWRIAATPDGIVLGTNYFGSLFTARPVYFFDPTWSQPVPDLRWFPAAATASKSVAPAAKGVVQALLAGASGPIAPPVTVTAFDPGTTVRSVAVAQGVATVDLHTPAPEPSVASLRRMRQQLTDSLQSLKGVQQVQVSIDGTPMAAPLLAPAPSPSLGALVLHDGTVGYVTGSGGIRPEPVLGRQIAAAKPVSGTGGTVSVGRRIAAILTSRGAAIVTPTRTTVIDGRSGLVAPTLDNRDWTYSVTTAEPAAWKVVDSRGRSVPFSATMPGMVSITSIEASRDGTRMLVLGQSQAGPTAFVAGIVRDDSGTPLGLTDERYAVDVPAAAAPLSATWVDATGSSVAVLTQDDTGDSVSLQQLGGLSSVAGRLSTTVSIVGTSKLEDLRALLQNGSIAELSGSVWQTTEPAGTADVLFVQR